jgi:hypothetical protein
MWIGQNQSSFQYASYTNGLINNCNIEFTGATNSQNVTATINFETTS